MATTPQKPEPSAAVKKEAAELHAAIKADAAGKQGQAKDLPPVALTPDDALALFKNGHRLAVMGDSEDNWFSMGRTAVGTVTYQVPLTDALLTGIMTGSFYLVEDQGPYNLSGG
jgi:hypothetical protein